MFPAKADATVIFQCRQNSPLANSASDQAEPTQAQGHRCWSESRQTFLGQASVPSSAPVDTLTGCVGREAGEASTKRDVLHAEIGCHHLPLLAGYQKLVGWAIRLQWGASNRLVAHFSRTAAGAILEF
jgi:hypothetical protein